MKKTLTAIFVLAIVSINISSCNKCYTCDFGKDGKREYCSKDFPDGSSGLKLTVDGYDKQGIKCTAN